jgi:putative integral membrane protein (TIGR02587 family)
MAGVFPSSNEAARALLVELARGFAGGLLFALPMLMTMELWQLGFYMDPLRLALLLFLTLPLLVGLSRYGGMRQTTRLREDVADAFIAFAIAVVASAALLCMLGLAGSGMPWREVVGKVAIQAVPASIGAILARNQMKEADADENLRDGRAPFLGELFLMAVGALFLSLNIAPTEEVILISYKVSDWQKLLIVLVSLSLMHGFVHSIKFRGSEPTGGAPFLSVFARFTVSGYAIVLLTCLYVLWTFGRTEGASINDIVGIVVVLGFPGALGAAAARLVL